MLAMLWYIKLNVSWISIFITYVIWASLFLGIRHLLTEPNLNGNCYCRGGKATYGFDRTRRVLVAVSFGTNQWLEMLKILTMLNKLRGLISPQWGVSKLAFCKCLFYESQHSLLELLNHLHLFYWFNSFHHCFISSQP